MRRAKAKKITKRYVTKRIFKAAVGSAVRKASDQAMRSMGYVVKAENGWVIRENSDGSKVVLNKIDQSHQSSLALD